MKRLLALILSLLLLCPFVISGCNSSDNASIQYLLMDEPITLDPQVATDANAKVVVAALFEGLTRLDENGTPYPGVAKSWESNGDHTIYTFYLREDAKWSDETPVTANDFVFAFQRALHPDTGSTTCEAMFCIKNAQPFHEGKTTTDMLGVFATDDHTLVVELEYANPDFPALTATAPFMPCNASYFNSTEGKYGLDSNCILGNGPFRMENRYSWEHDQYINLIRSSTYVGETTVSPYKLTMTIADDETSNNALTLLTDGTTDVASLPHSLLSDADSAQYTLYGFSDTTWGLCFNTQSDAMKNHSVRQLFIQSLNRDNLLAYIPNGGEPADDIITPVTIFNGNSYRNAAGSGFYLRQNISAVQKADKEKIPAITVLCPDDDSSKRLANQTITDWNASLGHYYNMEPLPKAELEQRIRSGDYDVAITSIRAAAEGPLSLLSLFRSDGKNNPAFLQSKEYDALLEITAASTPETVLENCRKAEQYLNENAVFYPLYYETRYYATPKTVTEVVIHPYELGIDFIHAKKS